MSPVKMIYKESSNSQSMNCLVYDFNITFDADGSPVDALAIAWLSGSESWVVAPVGCFSPAKNLNE